MNPAVFLDRDDTLVDNRRATAHTPHPGDLIDPSLVRLLPGAGEACAALAARFPLVVVTNQGGIAQGLCTHADVEAVNDRLRELLRAYGVRLAGVYYSPNRPPPAGLVAPYHTPHPWRKPGPGMLLAAARELGLDLSRSWMIGDAARDIEAGVAAGLPRAHCLLIGAPESCDDAGTGGGSGRFADLAEAADHVLRAATTVVR